jgi:hypothetical protein
VPKGKAARAIRRRFGSRNRSRFHRPQR